VTTNRSESSLKRIQKAKSELEAATIECEEALHEDTVTRIIDGLVLKDDGDCLQVETDAEELVIFAGEGNNIVINGDVGIIRIKTGHGNVVTIEGNVGGANISQGAGSSIAFFDKPDQVNVEQGAGSESVTVEHTAEEELEPIA